MTNWYISENGNDDNDGLQPNTPKRTLENLLECIKDAKDYKPSICFRRGSVWENNLDMTYTDFTIEEIKRINELE
jgi:hypothetical protein